MLTCIFENGNKTSLRHVVADVLLIDQNKTLLVKRAPHLSNPNKWGFIGGYINRDEWIEDAVKREAREESGYEIELGPLFRIVDSPKRPREDRQNISFFFLGKPVKKVGKPDTESTEIRWFLLDTLPAPGEFAFDHYQQIELYLNHLKKPFKLPIIGEFKQALSFGQ